MAKQNNLWLIYAIIVMVFWGIWGAFADYPKDHGFPSYLGYVVWSLTMIPPAIVALKIISWKIECDIKSIFLGLCVGLLGSGGQLILFPTLELAPPYLVFSYLALSPLVTIILALVISREKAAIIGWVGIVLAIVAGILLSLEDPSKTKVDSFQWVYQASLILIAWGIQGFVISYANQSMKAESIFFYMMLSGILLIPVALKLTNFDQKINWGAHGLWAAVIIQPLNAIGALLIVYAFRYGKAIIVAPMINAGAPVITIVLSLIVTYLSGKDSSIYWLKYVGMATAIIAALMMTWEESEPDSPNPSTNSEDLK